MNPDRIYIIYYLIAAFLLLLVTNFADASPRLENKISKLNVRVSKAFLGKLGAGMKYCKAPADITLAIIMTESSFKTNAYNKHTKDYGLMQINAFHVRKRKLSRERLLRDVTYNVMHGCQIFNWFYKTYPLNEAIMRYNVGTRKNAIKSKAAKRYLRNIYKYLNIIKGGK